MAQSDYSGHAAAAYFEQYFPFLGDYPAVLGVALLLLVAGISISTLPIVNRYLLRLVHRIIRRSSFAWGEKLMEAELFRRLAWAVPLLVFHQGLQFIPALPAELIEFFGRLTRATLLLVAVRAFAALLTAANAIYNTYPMARDRPINSYLQILNILAHLLAGIAIVATLTGQSPWLFLSGLGAMTAITMLVFRDTLLSLVAGMQLTANNLIHLGDWIEMPQFGADGDVVDISLHAVRVQNWDRTITVIPTHKFLDHAFKNWRGMTESGGRRIKRAFNVNLSTIRFLSGEEVEHFGKFVLLHDYIEHKKREIEAYNREHGYDSGLIANARRLTNVGTLRAYIVNYLRQHPRIRQDMTFLVRQLEPTPKGLPIEVYVFAADTAWANYEAIQADIFDHILAIIPEFGLRVYQEPSGDDFHALIEGERRLSAAATEHTSAVRPEQLNN